MRLSELKDGDALEMFADILEPAYEILSDEEVRKAFEGEHKMKCVKIAIHKHMSAVMEILARMDGVPVKDYHPNVLTIPIRLLEILSDKDLVTGFSEQVQTITGESFGSATESTEEKEI